jgi:ABC-2 type transport system permease protein
MTTALLIRCYTMEAKYSLLRLLRAPAFAIPTFLFPTMFYLLVGFLFGAFRSKEPAAASHIFTGFATMAAMTPGLFGFGIGLAMEREQGLFNYKRALPMPPSASLVGSVATCVISVIVAVGLLAVTGVSLRTVSLSALDVAKIVLLAAFGTIPFCSLGLWLGSMTSAKGAPAIVNILYLILIYFSGLFVPLPESIRAVVLASPAFYLHQLTLASIGARNFIVGSALNHVAVLVGVTVIFLGLATRRLAKKG